MSRNMDKRRDRKQSGKERSDELSGVDVLRTYLRGAHEFYLGSDRRILNAVIENQRGQRSSRECVQFSAHQGKVHLRTPSRHSYRPKRLWRIPHPRSVSKGFEIMPRFRLITLMGCVAMLQLILVANDMGRTTLGSSKARFGCRCYIAGLLRSSAIQDQTKTQLACSYCVNDRGCLQ